MDHIGLRFRDIFIGQKTGRLSFTRGGIQKSFLFQDGGLLFAKTNVSEERLGEILFRTGKIPADIYQTLPKYSVPNNFIGEMLIQRRVITQRDLYDALLAQVNVVALTCFSFFDATFDFVPQERFIDREFELRISLPLVIERGVRSMEFHPALKNFLAEKKPVPKSVSPGPYLTDEEKAFWIRMGGANVSAGVLESTSGLPPEKYWKTLFLFYCLDLIDLKDDQAETKFDRPEAWAAERFVERAADRVVEPGPSVVRPAEKAAPRVDSPPDKNAPGLEEQILEALELHRKLSEIDYFELLGIARNADEAEVKKAYFKLARRFHPDLFGRNLEPATKEKIDEVFDQITKAYRTLTSKDEKAAYTQKGAGPARKDDKDLGKNADVKFRQAKTLFNQGRFEEVVQLLEAAVRMKDDKGDYYLLLALAESRVPALSKRAERDFLKAIELEPWNAEPRVGLGILYKKEGLATRARKEFEHALEAEPEHKVARRELGELDEDPKKGLKGFFSKALFGSKKK